MKVLMKRAALDVARAVFTRAPIWIFRYYTIKNFQIDKVTADLETPRGGKFRQTSIMREWRRLGTEYRLHVNDKPWFFDKVELTTYSLSPTFVRWICEQLDIDFKEMSVRYDVKD